jgi:hypothetical protein
VRSPLARAEPHRQDSRWCATTLRNDSSRLRRASRGPDRSVVVSVRVARQADSLVRRPADTRQDARTKQADAHKDANADKRNADYMAAIEKCDALAGPTKDTSVSNAKVQYGES